MTTNFGARSGADDVLRDRSLAGKSMLVTGANSGIGFETARALALHGAHVLLGCRSRERAEEAATRIRVQQPGVQVSPVALDLASFASIRAAAAALPVDSLDVLICNAGLFKSKYEQTEDGIEQTVGVCHFGHFLLTSLLLPKLRAAAPARVVMVASESHRYPSTLAFDRFPLAAERYRDLVAYGQAKLCNVLFANELTRRYSEQGIYANSLHPGTMIGTSIFRDSVPAKVLATVVRPFTKSLAQGAATTVYCATAPELARSGGKYYANCREKEMSNGARDAAAARRLWELSEQRVQTPIVHVSPRIEA
jgi:WW domain-containing oxidoreductase